jgi:TP901 family phage tail tape measure protein
VAQISSLYKLQVLVDLADRLSGPIKGTIGRIRELEQVSLSADVAMERLQAGAALAGVGFALAAPLALATNEAIKFESAYADVVKVVETSSPTGLLDLERGILRLSNDIPIAAVGLTDITAAAGQANIQFSDLARFTERAAKVSTAFDMNTQRSGDSLAKLNTVYDQNLDYVFQLTDAVNHLSNKMASTAPDILEVLSRTSAFGKQVGMSGEQVAALGSAMLSTGSAPEVVGTGLNAMIRILSTATQGEKRFQKGLEALGFSAEGVERSMQKNAVGTIMAVLEAANKAQNPVKSLSQLFGGEFGDDAARLASNLGLVRQALGYVSDTTQYTGSVQKEFENRSATTANQLQLLQNRLTNIGIVVGQVFLPPLNAVLGVVGGVLTRVFELASAFPGLTSVIGTVTVVAALLLGGLGLLITTLGLVGFASAQARIGMAFLRQAFDDLALGAYSAAGRLDAFVARVAAAGGVLPFLRGQLVAAATAVRAFTASLLANPIFLIVAAVVALGAAFIWAWNNVEQFRTNVVAALFPIRNAWMELQAAVAQLGAAFGPVGAAISNALGRAQGPLDALAYGFGFFLGFVFTATVIVFGRVGAAILQALTGLVNIVRGFVNIVVGLFTGDLDLARRGASQVWTGIQQILSAPLRLFAPNWEALRGGLQQAWDWVWNFSTRMWDAGVNLVQGLINGITSKIGGVVDAVKQMTGLANKTVVVETKQKSPSALWEHYGLMLPAGLAIGIGGGASGVESAVSSLTNLTAMTVPAPNFTPPQLSTRPLEVGALTAPIPSLRPLEVGIPTLPTLSTRLAFLETPEAPTTTTTQQLPAPQQLRPQSGQAAVRVARAAPPITFHLHFNLTSSADPKAIAEEVAPFVKEAVLSALEELAIQEGYA